MPDTMTEMSRARSLGRSQGNEMGEYIQGLSGAPEIKYIPETQRGAWGNHRSCPKLTH